MNNEQVMQIMTELGLHEGGLENWVYDNAWVKVVNRALAEQSEQEPVAIDWDKAHEVLCDVWNRVISADDGFDAIQDLIYAAPVRTKDLTDDEINDVMEPNMSLFDFARAVIVADREKNK